MNGILNVYKEAGFTSFDVVAKLRGILHVKKIGHTGTLDPDATGVLPVCIGSATKVCALLTDKDKVYDAWLHLGTTTDTQDASGKILQDRSEIVKHLSPDAITQAILSFIGDYDQIPPMYSALKVGGKKLCDLAREGKEIERMSRPVHIYDIQILSIAPPDISIRVHCSKGTYIRTLCADIGEKLGCGGHMHSLMRTRVSSFTIEEAHTLAQIEEYEKKGKLTELILPVDFVFEELSRLQIKSTEEAKKKLCNGNILEACDLLEDCSSIYGDVRIYNSTGNFAAIYTCAADHRTLKCKKMFCNT